MDITSFAIWKFRYVEGFLNGMNAFDVTTTKYVDPRNLDVVWIKYDYQKETAKVQSSTYCVECKFSELSDKLKDLGIYHERSITDRHFLAGPQKEEESPV